MLYQSNQKVIRGFITSNNRLPDDAEDMLQEALMVLWERVRSGRFEQTAKLDTFVFANADTVKSKKYQCKGTPAPGTTKYRTEADQSRPARRNIPQTPEPAPTAAKTQGGTGGFAEQRDVLAEEAGPIAKSDELSKTQGTEEPSTASRCAEQVSAAEAEEKGCAGKLMAEKKEGSAGTDRFASGTDGSANLLAPTPLQRIAAGPATAFLTAPWPGSSDTDR